jgi:hypothetical protein
VSWPWLATLKELVEKKPLVILGLQQEWKRLRDSRRGVNEFTITRPHSEVHELRVPTPCLILGGDNETGDSLYFGLISSCAAVSTLGSRIKVKRAMQIAPRSRTELVQLLSRRVHRSNLNERVNSGASVIALTPKLSSHIIEQLASIEGNRGAMRTVADSLSSPKQFRSMAALQEDALQTALRAFGLAPGAQAINVELVENRETALARIGVIEDSVIEHDARRVPEYELVSSDITGRTIFTKDRDRLEVYTANRRPLEEVFGVDLIYLNLTRQNVVMVQYKMLEPVHNADDTDWIYRPDQQFEEERARMKRFSTENLPGAYEYRLNTGVFYIKFVKRDGALRNGGIVIPLDHYELLRTDPACRGPRDGLRISYDSLSGRYLRATAFVNLLQSGYIGAHADDTAHFTILIDGVLKNERAVVAALQTERPASEVEADMRARTALDDEEVADFEDLIE